MVLCVPPLPSLILQAFQNIPCTCACSSSSQTRLRWPQDSPEDGGLSPRPPGPSTCIHVIQCRTGFSSNRTPVSSGGASSGTFPEIADKTVVPPSLLCSSCLTLNAELVQVSAYTLSADSHPEVRWRLVVLAIPPASVFCGAGGLLFVVLLPSEPGGLGREQSPGAHPWRLPSRHSVTAVLCPRPSVCSPCGLLVSACPSLSVPFPISPCHGPFIVFFSLSSSSYPPDSLVPS